MPDTSPGDLADQRDMVRINEGAFAMGSEDFYPEEQPVRRVAVDGFWIDPHQITNAEFARFVRETGWVTEAERAPDPSLYPGAPPENLVPGSLVFQPTDGPVDLHDYSQWWDWTPGADWQHPTGPGSSLAGLDDHPVVHVNHPDAAAYCSWAGTTLPSEAEWEYAARGGLQGKPFTWGDDDTQETEPRANTWQGRFPYQNTEVDGWFRTAPVGSFEPNGYGLYDMAGNVWEWTDDWYRGSHRPGCTRLLHADEPTRRDDGGLDGPSRPRDTHPAQGPQGWLTSVRTELLPPLSTRCAAATDDRHRHESSRLPICHPPSNGRQGSSVSAMIGDSSRRKPHSQACRTAVDSGATAGGTRTSRPTARPQG